MLLLAACAALVAACATAWADERTSTAGKPNQLLPPSQSVFNSPAEEWQKFRGQDEWRGQPAQTAARAQKPTRRLAPFSATPQANNVVAEPEPVAASGSVAENSAPQFDAREFPQQVETAAAEIIAGDNGQLVNADYSTPARDTFSGYGQQRRERPGDITLTAGQRETLHAGRAAARAPIAAADFAVVNEDFTAPFDPFPDTPGEVHLASAQIQPLPESAALGPSLEERKITEILPHPDYEPDPVLARENPYLNLCPKPEHAADSPDATRRTPACPPLVKLEVDPYLGRQFAETIFTWDAPDLWYNPLYFEDAPLERYGHTLPCCVQPFASVGKFGVQLLGLPYQMSIDPLCSRRYTLGWYRPGEWAPKKCYQVPLNADAALAEGAVATGAIFLFP